MKIKHLIGGLAAGGVGTYAYTYSRTNFFTNVIATRAYAQGTNDKLANNNPAANFDFTQDAMDLSKEKDLASKMQALADGVEKSNHVGHIMWPANIENIISKSPVALALKEQIETKLASNNKHYQLYPTDFVYGVLSLHSYIDSKDGAKVEFPVTSSNSKYNNYITNWEVQKAYNVPEAGRYYSASYVNKEDRQLVLAHRGTTFKKEDALGSDSPLHTDLTGILGKTIVPQVVQTYVATKEAATFAKDHGYSFSSTGHSLGAWLAELSLYFSVFDFKVDRAKAVTFDSPGSVIVENFQPNVKNSDTERNVKTLDITTYLSAPNFVNTCSEHIGKVYRLYPNITIPPFIETSAGYLKWFWQKIVGSDKGSNIDALTSNFGHFLSPLVDTFDPLTGKPKTLLGKNYGYDEVKDWPVIQYKPSETIDRNMLTEFLGTAGANTADDQGLAVYLLSSIIKPTTLGAVVHLVSEAARGRINQQQYLDFWKYVEKEGSDKGYKGLKPSNVTQEFTEKYAAHYEVEEPNLYEEVYEPYTRTHFYLNQLFSCPTVQIERALDGSLKDQLLDLRKHYKMSFNGSRNNFRSHIDTKDSDEKLTMQDLQYRLERLMALDKEGSIKKLLEDQANGRNKTDIFTETSETISKFAKNLDTYSLSASPSKDLDHVINAAKQITPQYLQAMKHHINTGRICNKEFTDYLHCVYRAAYYYEYHWHNGLEARKILEQAKSLTESYWIKTFNLDAGAENLFNASIDKTKIYEAIPKGARHLPEMYTTIIYQLGRTYLFQGDRKEAIKYFELSKYLGNQLGLYEAALSDRGGLGVIEGDEINSCLINYTNTGAIDQLNQAKTKLKTTIVLYQKLKTDTKPYTMDYHPSNDEPVNTIIPCNDSYHRIECAEQMVKHYAKLISITQNSKERSEYTKAMTHQLRYIDGRQEKGLLIESEATNNKKKASVYNTLGGALFTLHDHNKTEFNQVKDLAKRQLHLTSTDDLEVIKEIFTKASQLPGTTKAFTTAAAHHGLVQVLQKQIALQATAVGILAQANTHQWFADIELHKQARDSINKELNRSAERDDIIIPQLSQTQEGEEGSHASIYSLSGLFSCFFKSDAEHAREHHIDSHPDTKLSGDPVSVNDHNE